MDSGIIVEWRIQPGDAVHRGDIVAVVDTDKSDIEIEVFEDGIIDKLLVEPGVEVPVGTVLAHIAPRVSPTGTVTAAPAPPPERPARVAPVASRTPRPEKRRPSRRRPAQATTAPFVRASPLARRRAEEVGVDLADVAGSGPGGAVLAGDVQAPRVGLQLAVDRAGPSDEAAHDRHDTMRKNIAALMARSKREIPHYYLATTIDLGASLAWMADINATRSVSERLLPAALLLKATALASCEVPAMNGFFDAGFHPAPGVHLGVAVSLRGGGLVAPALHNADQLDLAALMASLRDLVGRARAGRLRASEMSDPTITVTNLGDQGVEEVFGVIYPSQVALVGFGKIAERPWASGGLLGVRPVVRATLAADHRASDGHDGARFLNAIDRLLQHPEAL
jgi:pyruvate dehydrogenase E2 component (dihydrolipoamide acetyltransferase)